MRQRVREMTKGLAVLTAAGMFLVLVMGSTVTNTGSATGCGTSWPLCNGQFIPEFAVHTAIEYSHRAVTGIESLLILATSAAAWWFWRRRPEIRWLVPLTIAFLFLQAALGALAVVYSSPVAILALHFGISLIAFASTLLTALFLIGTDNGTDALRDWPVSAAIRRGVWGLTIYTYGVVYLGAYVNHSNASLACLDWPLCQGSVFPGFTGPVGIVFSHRLAAAILTVGVVALAGWCWRDRARRPDLAWASGLALLLLLAQSFSGAAVVWSRLGLFSTLAHSAIVALFFGTLTFLCLQVLPRPAVARNREPLVVQVPYRPAPSGSQTR